MNPEVQLMPSLPGVYKGLIDRSRDIFNKNEKGREFPISSEPALFQPASI